MIKPRRRGFLPLSAASCGALISRLCDPGFSPLNAPEFAPESAPHPAASAAPVVCKNTRRFRSLIVFLWHPNVQIFPAHLHPAAGMNLQANHAFAKFWRQVIVVHDLHAVHACNIVISAHGHLKVIPRAGLERPLAFGRWLCHPAAPATFVESPGVLSHTWIHFHLHAFDIGAVLGIKSGNARMEEDPAV